MFCEGMGQEAGTLERMRPFLSLALSAVGIVTGCTSSAEPSSDTRDAAAGPAVPDSAAADVAAEAVTDASVLAEAGVRFALTSAAFVEATSIPHLYACAPGGTNVSPPLAWTAGPAGAMSYAIVFTDLSNQLVHSVIYDIGANVRSLPTGVEKVYSPPVPAGAHQTAPGFGGGFGYAGPCPPTEHTYQFTLYALDVAALPGASLTTKAATAESMIKTHSLADAKLTGKYQKP